LPSLANEHGEAACFAFGYTRRSLSKFPPQLDWRRTMVDESVTVKGSPVRSLQKFIDAELDASQRDAMFGALEPEYARFRSPILATETVPLHMLNRLTEAAAAAKGEPLDAFARRAGREGANDAMKGVYRFFAMVLTPSAIISKLGLMWSAMYNRGELRVHDQSSHGVRIQLADFPTEPAGCARFSGWIEKVAELTGAKNVKIEKLQCFTKGEACCEWKLEWE
jgi:hypothetical protein